MKLTCKANGVPTPNVAWKNPSGKVIQQVIGLKNILDVLMSSDQDFGNYTCEATNDVDSDISTVLVQQISKKNVNCALVVYTYISKRFRKKAKLLPRPHGKVMWLVQVRCRLGNGSTYFFHFLHE